MVCKKRSHEEAYEGDADKTVTSQPLSKFSTPEPEDIQITSDELQRYIHIQSQKLSSFINVLDSLRGFLMPFIYKVNEEFNQLLLFNRFDNVELYKVLRMLFHHFDLFYKQGLVLQKVEYEEEDELFKYVSKELSWDENVLLIEFILEAKKDGLSLKELD